MNKAVAERYDMELITVKSDFMNKKHSKTEKVLTFPIIDINILSKCFGARKNKYRKQLETCSYSGERTIKVEY